jgi:hypothetical protein
MLIQSEATVAVTYLGATENAVDLDAEDSELIQILLACLDADIDSWCTSSIACCDTCLDQFIARWPLAYNRHAKMQRDSWSLDRFYESARRVQELVEKPKFDQLIAYVACPRCGAPIGPNLSHLSSHSTMWRAWRKTCMSLGDSRASHRSCC